MSEQLIKLSDNAAIELNKLCLKLKSLQLVLE